MGRIYIAISLFNQILIRKKNILANTLTRKNKKKNFEEERIQALLKKESIDSKIVSEEIEAIKEKKKNKNQLNVVERLLKKIKNLNYLKNYRLWRKKRKKTKR